MRTSLVLPLSVVALAAILPAAAHAGVASVNGAVGAAGAVCPHATVADAIAAAGPNDTVYVKPGTYTIAGQTISDNITIVSSNFTCASETDHLVTFVGNNVDRMFIVNGATVQFRDLTLRDNSIVDFGGLIWVVAGGSAIVDGSHLRDGTSSAGGGCVAVHTGGAVSLWNGAELTGCESLQGGGIYVDNGTALLMPGTSVNLSAATDAGGGIFARLSSLYVYGDVSDNTAGDNGGGIHVDASFGTSLAVVSGATITGNSSAAYGGGISHEPPYGTLTINGGTVISDNTAVDGGGVAMGDGTLGISGEATLANNAASDEGGGLWLHRLSNATLAGTGVGDIYISANTAGGHGGGLATDTPDVEATFVTFIDNVAAGRGGGVHGNNPLGSSETLSLQNTRFLRNSGSSGGGLYADGLDVEISSDFASCDTSSLAKERFCSEFRKNEATATSGAGGGIAAMNGAVLTVETTSFFQNSASQGAALGVHGSTSEALLRSGLVWDHPAGVAALEAVAGGDLEVRASTLVENGAPAIWAAGTTGVFHRNVVYGNSSTLGASALSGNCNLYDDATGGPAGTSNYELQSTDGPQFDTTNARSEWMPLATSVAIDACSTGPSVDLDGTSRAQGADYDRGAFERP